MRFLKFADDMPNFSDVKDDIPIYRYFSYCKIKDFFEKEALWFCNATQFYDKLERRIPDSYFQNWDKEVAERYKSLYEMKKEDPLHNSMDFSHHNHVNQIHVCYYNKDSSH